jgi:hypothetical protein
MESQEPIHRLPISTFVSRLNRAWDEELFRTLLRQMVGDQMGVMITNLREPIEGTVTSTESEPLHLGMTTYGDGKIRVLAFADPILFRGRYGDKFNAEMSGLDLFRGALANGTCAGVLVNSALSSHSVAIDRAAIQWALDSPQSVVIPKKPWWRVW